MGDNNSLAHMKTLFSLFLSLIFAVQTAFAVSDGLALTMVDVGAAECLIITVDDEAMIVDSGYAKSWENIEQAIQSMGIESITYFVITHPHADHIGSAAKILENYDVDQSCFHQSPMNPRPMVALKTCLPAAAYR